MDVPAIKLEARLAAIEHMLADLYRMTYALVGVSVQDIEKAQEKFREHLRTMPMPGNDPAIADLAAAELQEAHERLLGMILNAVKGQ